MTFQTAEGTLIPALTTDQMREVDRIAVEDFQLGILLMMENAGRNLAQLVRRELGDELGSVVVLAGSGGNGGGGICCARHLRNHGIDVALVLSKEPASLGSSASKQLNILTNSGLQPIQEDEVEGALQNANIIVDALIGYSLRGAPHGRTAELIELANLHGKKVISLDVPSGMDSTTGDTPGTTIHADVILTLALPKTGLEGVDGDLYLADIGIPPEVYSPFGIHFEPFFDDRYWIPIWSA
ncbi:MAG: NAD(P)H-hydrate epimerase [Anaerolineales bacterium]|nr:NAD(P)H-hydrate epimerase [Anaerolineales bacterium]